ncbi:MAG: CoB--CoM heterodisulfide reductase iron-sulfur subunit A family protein, partial [Candidatus Hydrogenedentota bacterium]
DFNSVAEFVRSNPDVAFVRESELLCQPEGLKLLAEETKTKGVDRVVIAACSPRLHEEKFASAAAGAGISPELVRVCNIREQCGWYAKQMDSATEWAQKIVQAAVGRARLSTPIEEEEIEVNRKVLVIGGGIAGIQSAIEIVNFGYDVTLIERAPELGGIVSQLDRFYQLDISPQDFIGVRIENIDRSEKIDILTSTSISHVNGSLGGFDVELDTSEGRKRGKFGALVVATGTELKFERELYGVDLGERFVTQLDFEGLLADEEKAGSLLARGTDGKRKRVFIIIGLGNEDAKLSSANMLKYALRLRRDFDCEVYVAARHVKVAAPELERMYTEAREEGAVFFKFLDPSTVRVSAENGATVRILDPLLVDKELNEYEMEIPCDLVVLEETYSPDSSHAYLEHVLGARPGPRGFYQEDNPHLLPIRTSNPGVFVAGSARQPMLIPEVLVDAGAVAAEVHRALSGGKVLVKKDRMRVEKNKCVLCLNCKRVCPHDAVTYAVAAVISETACQACGTCAAVCPNMAIRYTNETNEIYDIELESLV